MKVTFHCKIVADLPSKTDTSIQEILNMVQAGTVEVDWAYSLDNTGEPTVIVTEKK